MGSPDRANGPDDGVGRELAADLLAALGAHRKEMARVGRAAKALSRGWSDPKAVEKAVGLIEARVEALPDSIAAKAAALRDEGARWIRSEREGRRRRLAKELTDATRAQGLRLLLVTKEPLEIRIPPLGARIDLEKARASIVFGRVEVAQCPAGAEGILKAREKALKALERRKWSPEAFHRTLRKAWAAAARRLGRPEGWIELAEVLPELAFAVQGPRWRYDPTPRNLTPYGKAQFLYDLHRLREAGKLAVGGWRLSLGPATGASTRDKRKVFWVEDAEGRGAYHLTLRFVEEEGIHGESS